VHNAVIGIAAEPHAAKVATYQTVKRILQKQIGQQRTNDTTLRGALRPFHQLAVRHLHWHFQPTLNVQQDPWRLTVLSERTHKQFVVDVVKQTFDIELDYPVVFPASPPHHGNRIVRRAPGTIAIEIGMKDRIKEWVNQLLDHRLCHPVCHCRHSQHAHPTRHLRNGHAFHRRRKVAPGTHAIPELVQVVVQIFLELPDRLLIQDFIFR
jgi:hypothetical protein